MIWATEYKHVDLVKLLLSKGSDINIRDNVSPPGGTLGLAVGERAGRDARAGCGSALASSCHHASP